MDHVCVSIPKHLSVKHLLSVRCLVSLRGRTLLIKSTYSMQCKCMANGIAWQKMRAQIVVVCFSIAEISIDLSQGKKKPKCDFE